MPDYGQMNALDAQRPLPAWFWTGDTKMNCMHHAITQSLQLGYAHHIQRLMITGNMALLLGCLPDAVDEWYLGIYIDAFEWVELPNTRGMSQFADGGLLGSKPYCGTATYMHKQSDYCGDCHYNAKQRHGDGACPLNSLYWDFHVRHRERLGRNPRLGMTYRTWDKKTAEEQTATLRQAAIYIEHINLT
jgi:deoxyribodipyrimidine photolyase-related protein